MKTKEQPKQLGIHFGALAEPIRKQLKEQGFKFKIGNVSHYEKQAEAIIRLRFASLISDSVSKKAQDKLYKKIQKHVLAVNKLSIVK